MKKIVLLSAVLAMGIAFVSCGKEDPQKKEEKKEETSDFVDLGTGIKWATCNLGASKPWEYGGYYQWAGLEDVSDESICLDWSHCPYHTGTDKSCNWTKYITNDALGIKDDVAVLDVEKDDIARATLGGKWRMPTKEECDKLIDGCNLEFTYDYKGTGVAGMIFTSKKYPDRSIFLPAGGFRDVTTTKCEGIACFYWTSTLDAEFYSIRAWYMYFEEDDQGTDFDFRYYGHPIRPVTE